MALSQKFPSIETLQLADTTIRTNSPLVLGVSGHRNLHPGGEQQLGRQIADFLDDLKRRMPDTELRVMVGMAQGADLLVARAALTAGYQVDAILPMPLDRYIEDFDAASSTALLSLLKEPLVHCTVLPAPPGLDPSAPVGAERDALYANLMEALIDKCNLLLALWDGQPSHLPGGTADTVLRYLGARTLQPLNETRIEIVTAIADPAWGPHFVYWIPTMRTDDPALPTHEPCYLSGIGENLLAVHRTIPHTLQQQLSELNTYNREFERLQNKHKFGALDSLMPALGAISANDRDSLRRIDFEYGKADALAIYYQQHSDRLFQWFSYMASCMALLFLVYAKLLAVGALLSVYLAILVLGVVVFHFVRNQKWFSKHLIYRALAETMRTKFFLRAARADRLVNAAELIRLTGIDQFSGFSWIRNLLKNIEPLNGKDTVSSEEEKERLESVHRHWIRGQQTYFSTRVRKLERNSKRLESMKSIMLYAIAALAVVLLLFSGRLHSRLVGAITAKDIIIFLMGLLPVWLGIWELYQNKLAMRELLWQYRNQLSHFTRAELQLSRTTARDRRKEVLAQVGMESLMESYLWTIHRYHREYEPPSAG
jgi:hypothetical protein